MLLIKVFIMVVKSEKTGLQIEKEYAEAARALCEAKQHALDFLEKMKHAAARSMRPYVDNLPLLINYVSSSAADAIEKSGTYKHCAAAVDRFENLVDKERKKLETRKLSSKVPYEHEVHLYFPLDAKNIARMHRMALRYQDLEFAVSRRHKQTVDSLQGESGHLPVTYAEYAERSAQFHEEIKDIDNTAQNRLSTLKFFPGLRRYGQ